MHSILFAGKSAPCDTQVNATTPCNRDRAVVIGGSMAGLAVARVLSDHFREVILVERGNRFTKAGEYRRGVHPRYAHSLLAGGRNGLERLFPSLREEVIQAGAMTVDMIGDGHWCFEGGEHVRFESGLEGLMVSRPLLEGIVRERVRKIPNIHFLNGHHVENLIASLDNKRVIGINLGDSAMPADLVVDATGRASRSAAWLHAIGYDAPDEERVEVNIAYATRQFRRAPGQLNGALFASIPATMTTGRGGVIVAQEGDLWAVTLNSYVGVVPTDLAAFIKYAKTLPSSHIHDVVSQAEPVGEAFAAHFPVSLRRRYEYLNRFPEGYLVIGDAISSFNPFYGQGISVAVLEAVELDKALHNGDAKLAKRFFVAAAKIVDVPWSITAGNDLRMPRVTAAKTRLNWFHNWYIALLHVAAHCNPRLAIAFHNTANLLEPPKSLLTVPLVVSVLFAALSRRMARNRASRLEAAARGAF